MFRCGNSSEQLNESWRISPDASEIPVTNQDRVLSIETELDSFKKEKKKKGQSYLQIRRTTAQGMFTEDEDSCGRREEVQY